MSKTLLVGEMQPGRSPGLCEMSELIQRPDFPLILVSLWLITRTMPLFSVLFGALIPLIL